MVVFFMGRLKILSNENNIAIKNCEVITPFRVIKRGVIVIKDGKISKVGTEEKVTTPSNAEIVDVSGKIVVPKILV